MSRTPIPERLIHKSEEVKEDAELFDAFCSLIPKEVIPIEPIWPEKLSIIERFHSLFFVIFMGILAVKEREVSLSELLKRRTPEEKQKENEEYTYQEQKMVVSQIASAMFEGINQKVEKEGVFKLPFGLVVTKPDKVSSILAELAAGSKK